MLLDGMSLPTQIRAAARSQMEREGIMSYAQVDDEKRSGLFTELSELFGVSKAIVASTLSDDKKKSCGIDPDEIDPEDLREITSTLVEIVKTSQDENLKGRVGLGLLEHHRGKESHKLKQRQQGNGQSSVEIINGLIRTAITAAAQYRPAYVIDVSTSKSGGNREAPQTEQVQSDGELSPSESNREELVNGA